MAYRFKPGRSIEAETRRIAGKELTAALRELGTVGSPPGDEAVHEARRRVKKVRALVRLVRPTLDGSHRVSQARLQAVSHLIAPVCDAEALPGTLARVEAWSKGRLPRGTALSMREALARRRLRIDRDPHTGAALRAAVKLLRAEQREVLDWRLDSGGRQSVEHGLRRIVRRGHRAMARAAARPTGARFDRWRRRVKDYWLQLRLVEDRCGKELLADQQRLEALDGLLGEQHNVVLLQALVAAEASLPRQDRAALLRLLREYRRELEHRAQALGAEVYAETPRQVVSRLRRAWRAAETVPAPVGSTETRAPGEGGKESAP